MVKLQQALEYLLSPKNVGSIISKMARNDKVARNGKDIAKRLQNGLFEPTKIAVQGEKSGGISFRKTQKMSKM